MNILSRRIALRGLIGSVALGAVATVGVAPVAQARPPMVGTPDEQLDRIVRALESLPDHLKAADPKTYPNYQEAIEPYLEGLTTMTVGPSGDGVNPNFDFWRCAASLAGFIATNGFPVLRIITWIQQARKYWRGVKGIYYAIRSGEAAARIGSDAAVVLGSLLGVDGIVKWCFQ